MHVEAREQQTDSIIGLELAQQARPVAMEPQGSTCLLFPRSPFMHSLCFELKVLCAFKKYLFILHMYVFTCVNVCACVKVRGKSLVLALSVHLVLTGSLLCAASDAKLPACSFWEAFLSLCSIPLCTCWDCRQALLPLAFHGSWGFKPGSSWLCSKRFSGWTISLTPDSWTSGVLYGRVHFGDRLSP